MGRWLGCCSRCCLRGCWGCCYHSTDISIHSSLSWCCSSLSNHCLSDDGQVANVGWSAWIPSSISSSTGPMRSSIQLVIVKHLNLQTTLVPAETGGTPGQAVSIRASTLRKSAKLVTGTLFFSGCCHDASTHHMSGRAGEMLAGVGRSIKSFKQAIYQLGD